ncbi:type II secretion system protein [Shewanella sp. VB17]|uniref:PilW family protein n=1 Tax=Shewanella sp. VB17 TaxID=2739432 RepID=UPI00156392CE|nr:type II secretion system protein [Shewanella sp. VB17]NRD72483.1 type II secretion system protein [Shewanella sp. VB17]
MVRLINAKTSRGFTLVEMVTVIIILGVLVLGVSSFVVLGTRIFVESTSVEQVLAQSRFAIERMTRELRNALPNSLRLTSGDTAGVFYQCVEFVPIQASASYVDLPFSPSASSNTGIVFTPSQGINPAHKLLVYPLTNSHVYTVTSPGSDGRLFDVSSFIAATGVVTFDAAVRFAESSPIQRYYMIDDAVSYCFESAGELRRYANYGLNSVQMTPNTNGVLMAENITNNLSIPIDAPIRLTGTNLVNNAMLQLAPRFSVNGQAFQYQHQVQVINVP